MSFDWTSFFGGAADYLLNDIEQKKGAERAKQLEADRRASQLALQQALLEAQGKYKQENEPYKEEFNPATGMTDVYSASGRVISSRSSPGLLKKSQEDTEKRAADEEARKVDLDYKRALTRQANRPPAAAREKDTITPQIKGLLSAAEKLGDAKLYSTLTKFAFDEEFSPQQRLQEMNQYMQQYQYMTPEQQKKKEEEARLYNTMSGFGGLLQQFMKPY